MNTEPVWIRVDRSTYVSRVRILFESDFVRGKFCRLRLPPPEMFLFMVTQVSFYTATKNVSLVLVRT